MASSVTSAAAMLPTPEPKPKTAEGAAKQFESLLLGEMLRSVRESTSDDDDEDDNTKQTMLDLADQQFAKVMANNGGVGMATMIVKGLKNADQQ
ncbi:MAG TPA: rod-binding protein [Bryobacteraceae bacterium]|jgi:peptidoglycan hydrolase FlgJ|nr:rod-binding protein [Bryobacteraceae bacterium]